MVEAVKILTAKKALGLLANVVAEHGVGHVYEKIAEDDRFPACMYVQRDEEGKDCPSCLVGHVMHRFGVPLEALRRSNRDGVYTLSLDIDRDPDLPFGISNGAATVLGEAQNSQDEGDPWGIALAKAVHVYAELEAED